MRITNALITRDIISRLATNSAKLAEAQDRVSTGLKVKTMSDDPTAGSAIMQASSGLRAIDQYKKNVAALGSELDAEDTALGQVTDVLTRAKELAVGQAGANANAQSRAATAAEVKQLIAQVIQVGNTKLGPAYVFGGVNSPTTAPFDSAQVAQSPMYVSLGAGGTPQLPQGMRSVEIATGQFMQGAHSGDTVFVQTGTLGALQQLYDGLVANDDVTIQAASASLDTAFGNVQSLVGDVGARRNQVETVSNGLAAFEANLTSVKSGLSEVDMEQAITDMVARQTAYQAAMLASSKVMGLSLTDYLR